MNNVITLDRAPSSFISEEGIVEAPRSIGLSSNEAVFGEMPGHIAFNVATEPLERAEVEKKYVLNADADLALGVVSSDYPVTSHAQMFGDVQTMLRENIAAPDLRGVTVKYKAARHGAWAFRIVTGKRLQAPGQRPH